MGYEQSNPPKKRLVGLFLAVLFHACLVYALITGMAKDFIKKAQKNFDVSIIEEVKLPPPPPPPPPPKETPEVKPVEQPKAYVPPVEVAVENTPSESAISAVTNAAPTPPVTQAAAPTPPPPPPPPVVKPKVHVKAVLEPGCTPPRYPDESIEMEEEGTVLFNFLIEVDGHVAESKLIKTSGFNRLDQAAKAAFERCRFQPGTVDGVPEKSWVQQSFEWKIK